MNKKNLIVLCLLMLGIIGAKAQIVTSSPAMLQENSENVVIYYHADMGNQGLINQSSSSPIYAHTGVITSESTTDSDWKYAPTWLDNSAKYQMEYVSENLWKLTIGNIRTYYGVPDGVTVKKLAFVFRNATGTKEGKTASGGDIFVEVYNSGLQVSLTADIEGTVIQSSKTTVNFTAACSSAANLYIKVNGQEIASAQNSLELSGSYNFTQYGDYTVSAIAELNGQTVTDEVVYTYPTPSPQQNYPGGVPQMGAVRNSDGSVTFCIAAPNKNSAIIVGSWDDYQILTQNTMYYQDYDGDRYFWITVNGLNATDMYPYYYYIDNISVGDPYAKLVLDPSNDKYISSDVYPNLPSYPTSKISDSNVPLAVYQENINDYNWAIDNFKGVAKEDLIIYEILLRDFTGTEGKALGDGTVKQALAKIPYLKELGVNAVELLPINEFNGNNSWGYNPNFYFAPDKAYGTPDDYKEFIDACHQNGIAVILDMVFNQSDWLHPWYQLYSVGSNPFYNADAPHAYSVLNDWNQGNPLVQKQFCDVLKYWLREYKVDGFRFDLVKGLGDNSSYSNNGDAATNAYNATRVARMKTLHAAMKEVNEDAYFINENLAGAQEENQMAEDGELNWANINTEGGQFAMGYSSDSSLARFYAPYDSRTWGSTVSYLESHDEQRLAYQQNQYGETGIKGNITNSMRRLGSAAAQMILAPGSHMIWQFSELGNYDSAKTSSGSNNVDPKTVRWSLFNNANRKGLYTSYSELIAIRNANTALFGRSADFLSQCTVSNWANGRFIYASNGEQELICVINPNVSSDGTFQATFKQKDNSKYQILSKSYNTDPSFDASTGKVTVPANGYVVIATKNVTEVSDIISDTIQPEVFGGNGYIYVNGDYSDLTIYNVAGQKFNTLNVPAGLYIVRAGGETFKVMVK